VDDAAALAGARAGDLDAYEVLVARFTAPAYRAATLLGARDDAEDVVQEAFVKAYHKLGAFRGDAGAFRAWLLAIVANQTRNLHRTRRRYDALVLREAARYGSHDLAAGDPADAAEAGERRGQLLAALRALPDRDRDVIVCRYLLDLSEAQTAAALGWRTGTVKSRTARALARLREHLRPAGGHAPNGVPEVVDD
jgi:RNA polymerase sigma-70 factor (ECF subfamily)